MSARTIVFGAAVLAASVVVPAQDRAAAIVERALAAHGGLDPIEAAGGLELAIEGTFDLTTRLQGRSDLVPEPKPIRQTLAVDPAGGRLAFVLDWHNYYQSRQRLQEVHRPDRSLFVDLVNRQGGWSRARPAAAARLRRFVPAMLLRELLDHRDRMEVVAGPSPVVRYRTPDAEVLTLAFDADRGWLTAAETPIVMPILGDTTVRWEWSGHAPVGGLVMPRRLRTTLGGRVLMDARIDVRLGVSGAAFEPLEGVEVAPPRAPAGGPPPVAPAFVPYGQRDPQVESLGGGLHLVRSLRPGFHLLFVEFSDFVLAVDAPAGWYEMHLLPPANLSPGDTTSALGEKYLRAIRQTTPKPVRHVVLTHHHSDHIGGIRPFVAAGATIVAGAPAARLARIATAAPSIEIVSGTRTIADARQEVRLIELPAGNPKADGYLMVYLPRQRVLYTTAFIYPVPRAQFPRRESLDLSTYFVDWLDASGLDVERIYNVHGTGLVEAWQLDELRAIARGRR